ncbi:MAG: hypothetical protein BroJett005_01640 [Ignavibacteriota bacterium]|nr:MAG: hypothetical protein BroJett005_01640 [Ignavibacteriota bacterium]
MNFNGLISLLLACIEFLLLFNLLVFVKKDKTNTIALIMIALLAGYQAMEFLMCQVELQSSFFPYFAFIIISFLPPLNLILTLSVTHSLDKKTYLVFIPAIFFTLYYSFVISEFAVTSCTVLYASYHYPLGDLYGFFYYLPVLISIVFLNRYITKHQKKQKKIIARILLFGAVFISLPVLLGFTLMLFNNYSIISAMESIMCKFAFVYAICLTIVCLYNSPFNEERNYLKLFSGCK